MSIKYLQEEWLNESDKTDQAEQMHKDFLRDFAAGQIKTCRYLI